MHHMTSEKSQLTSTLWSGLMEAINPVCQQTEIKKNQTEQPLYPKQASKNLLLWDSLIYNMLTTTSSVYIWRKKSMSILNSDSLKMSTFQRALGRQNVAFIKSCGFACFHIPTSSRLTQYLPNPKVGFFFFPSFFGLWSIYCAAAHWVM